MGFSDLYNRQLHPEERTLAKDIAEKSDGLYTQAQVEDQMRIMGMCVNGGCVSPGVAEELNGRTPTDPGAQWINTGLTNADGNPLVIQSLPAANPALQAYIMANYNSATPGQIPSAFTYVPSQTQIDWKSVRNTTADAAQGVSTAAGRFSAITAAAAQYPSPYAPGLITASYVGTATGMVADAVAQLAKPDVGEYWTNSASAMVADRLSTKYPLASPVINEGANYFNGSSSSLSIQDFLNSSWSRITNQAAAK